MGKSKVLVKVQPEGKYSLYPPQLQFRNLTDQPMKLSTAMERLISTPLRRAYALPSVPIHTPSIRSSETRSIHSCR
jgi:hypothetical protein